MNPVFKQYASGFLIALFLSGCATHTPKKMYKGEVKNAEDFATILVLKDWTNWFRPVSVWITKLDGELAGTADVLQVDPGSHVLVLYANHDGMQPFEPPVITVSVEAGQVYQLTYQLVTHHKSLFRVDTGRAVYSLQHKGSHKNYEAFLAKNPEYKAGTRLFIHSLD